MEIEIESRRENKLLGREEIHFVIKYEGATPRRQKVKEELKKALGLKGFVLLQYIKPMFGLNQAKVYAKVYPSEEEARKIEEDYIIRRNIGGKKEEEKEEKKEETKEKKEEEKGEKEGKEVKEEAKEEVDEAKGEEKEEAKEGGGENE